MEKPYQILDFRGSDVEKGGSDLDLGVPDVDFRGLDVKKGGLDLDLGVPDIDFRGSDVEKGGSDPRNNHPQQTNLCMQRYRSCF